MAGCYPICASMTGGFGLAGQSCILLVSATLSLPWMPVGVATLDRLYRPCYLYSSRKEMVIHCSGRICRTYVAAMVGCVLSKNSCARGYVPLGCMHYDSS